MWSTIINKRPSKVVFNNKMKRLYIFLICIFYFFYSINFFAENIQFQPASYGDKDENVKLIQEKLINLNYMNTEASGIYLEKTKQAIINFQNENGIKPTGIADKETIHKLSETMFRELKPGDNSFSVIKLQEKLIALGYLDTKATGLYKNQTENAVKTFQQRNSLPITGIADIATQDVIYKQYMQHVKENIASVNDGRGYNLKHIGFSRLLTRASEGEDVKTVQLRLKELGFFEGPISGYFMNQTIAAIKRFQYFNGLDQSGECDKNTWDMLLNDKNVVDIYSTPAPTLEPILPEYAITVDVNNQVILIYKRNEDGNYNKLVKTMICSTGLKATPSDVGVWTINGRKANWCYFPKFNSHARYWTNINNNIAFHSVIYKKVDNMSLSIKSYKKLGERASHGCIRLMVHDAKWIYDNILKGTKVTVTEDLPYDEELRMSLKKPPLNRKLMWPASTPEPTHTPSYSSDRIFQGDFRDLHREMKGVDIYWLQSKLKELGYYKGTVTGEYYSGTLEAVKNYQKDKNLKITGIADVNMQKLLYSKLLNTPLPIPVITPTLEN